MTELENVIKALECCNSPNNHEDCPYNREAHYNICTHKLLTDAISLLKAQADEIAFLKRMQQQLVAGMDASEVGAMAMKAMRGE